MKNIKCDCEQMDNITIRREVIGYGRELYVGINFLKKSITTWYDHSCDNGTGKNFEIKFCPLCGRDLYEDGN